MNAIATRQVSVKGMEGVIERICSLYNDSTAFKEVVSLVAREVKLEGRGSNTDRASQDDLTIILQFLLVRPGHLGKPEQSMESREEHGVE